MRLTVAALALLWAAPTALADDPAAKKTPAQDALKAGLEKAKAEGKVVFLVFGSPGCGWCKLLEKYHDDADVQRVLGKRYVFVKVDAVETPGGEALYKKYTKGKGAGVPYWVVLDPGGKVLIDADDGQKGNVGFPYEPHEVAHYVKALKETYPGLTPEERDLLVKKLKDVAPKK
jgi:thiol-disulfide isomerase/thioredoxin